MTSYLTSMDTISLSRTVFEIFDFNVSRVWPWPLTPKGHLGSKIFIPFERPYMTSYLTSMDTISLSRTVFEIFDFKVFRVWPWPLTPKGHLESKKLYLSKGHIWLSIWLLWTPSLYLVPFSRYSTSMFLGFDLDLWTLKVIWGQNFYTIERLYMTSYLTSMNTISLSRTVFEIFDFEVFRVWPWPFTPKDHLGSKKIIPFERPYMTSYLTSMDTISLSRTVLEIFDFNVSRVWPWPLTPKGHLGSKNFIPYERPYMTSYLTSMDTISLSRTVFEIFDFNVSRVWPWPLTPEGHLGSKTSIPLKGYIWLPIWLLWTPSLYLVPFSRYSTSKFLGFDLDLLPLKIIWGQKKLYHSKGHIWLPIWLLWTPSLYLVPFSRYSTSMFLGFDLDLWPLKVIWGQKFLYHSKGHIWLPIWLSMDTISLSRTVFEIFDFNVSRVWPWPLTPEGHLGSKNFIPFERPYMTSYLTSMDTMHLSISYRFRDIRLRSF